MLLLVGFELRTSQLLRVKVFFKSENLQLFPSVDKIMPIDHVD